MLTLQQTLDRHHIRIPVSEARLSLRRKYSEDFIGGHVQAYSIYGIHPHVYLFSIVNNLTDVQHLL